MKLGEYIIYRIMAMFAQICGIISVIFAMINLIPYDPTVFFLFSFQGSNQERNAQLAALRAQLGLDLPVYKQIINYIGNLFSTGSMGDSWISGAPVNEIVLSGLQTTVSIFGMAFMVYTPIAIGAAIYSAVNRGKLFDVGTRVLTSFTYSIPSYILGLYFVYWGITYKLSPWPSNSPGDFGTYLRYSFLPILSVVLIYTGFQYRLIRSHMLQILRENYITTAQAKGLDERTVIMKHALRNVLPFIFTTIAVTFPIAFSGVAALEVVFTIPGVGLKMVRAASNFDWPVLVGCSVIFTSLNAIILTFTDIMINYTSPKLRFGRGR